MVSKSHVSRRAELVTCFSRLTTAREPLKINVCAEITRVYKQTLSALRENAAEIQDTQHKPLPNVVGSPSDYNFVADLMAKFLNPAKWVEEQVGKLLDGSGEVKLPNGAKLPITREGFESGASWKDFKGALNFPALTRDGRKNRLDGTEIKFIIRY